MKHCTQCGHMLGLGRFCTNCGASVAPRPDPLSDPIDHQDHDQGDWRTDTAERPPAPTATVPATPPPAQPSPRTPPVAVEPPPPPRFPLYADEIDDDEADAQPTAVAAPVAPAVEPDQVDEPALWDDDDWDDDRRPRVLVVLGGILAVAALAVGAWFVGQHVRGDDPDDPPSSGGPAQGGKDVAVDHTTEASAEAPATAPPGEDVDGNTTSYDASNMLDGVPRTTWRAEGDLSGAKIVFTFPEKTRITEVGLINGYAKKARDGKQVLDWYEGHRRILQVTWIFSGGTTVRQDLVEDRKMQAVEVDPVEVTKVVLKIVSTSAPGEGDARRDYTAISDVLLAEG